MTEAEKKISDEIAKMDLYKTLGVSHEASEKAIVKGYRKLALKYHPDKNPDNPAAVDMFHKLSKALEILTDKAAKAAYDKIQKAKRAAELRLLELDSKRRKLRDDLESREKAATQEVRSNINAQANLEAEILRLRKEGSRLLQEEQERLREQIQKSVPDDQSDEEAAAPRLKVKWKAKKGDPDNGGYTREVLTNFFHKYGDIAALVLSSKKVGSAIIEFVTSRGAQLAYDNETGLSSNPFTLTWISGQPKTGAFSNCADTSSVNSFTQQSYTDNQQFSAASNIGSNLVSGFSFNSFTNENEEDSKGNNGSTSVPGSKWDDDGVSNGDFESIVLMKMKQAQERKRLAEQMAKDDEDQKEQE